MSRNSSQKSDGKSPWPRYRTKHRQQSHEQAHAAHEAGVPDVPVFDHSLVCDQEPLLVSTPADLQLLLAGLRADGCFGYDSEFIGEQNYFPRLCVIQVATTKQVAIIDPLPSFKEGAALDLTGFWELLADESVEKIVHAGDPDLEPVARHLNRPPRHIFDTQVAAAFAGLTANTQGEMLNYPMSLGKLLRQVTGLDLMPSNRSLKFSQWDHRPLSQAQLNYASNDVRYLPLLRHALTQQIRSHENEKRVIEDFAIFSDLNYYRNDPQAQKVRVRGVEKLSRRHREVLRALLVWRDEAAREQDVPIRTFMKDDVLYALASSPVSTKAELKRVAGLPRPVEREYGQIIVNITRQAMECQTVHPATPGKIDRQASQPKNREASEICDPIDGSSAPPARRDHREHVDVLWSQIESLCRQHHIHPAIATSKRELDAILFAASRGKKEVTAELEATGRLFRGWRRELFGDLIEEALRSLSSD